jgi:hypothetical protein
MICPALFRNVQGLAGRTRQQSANLKDISLLDCLTMEPRYMEQSSCQDRDERMLALGGNLFM